MSADKPVAAGLSFVDFLFTVAIGVGLTGVGKGGGLLAEDWVKEGRWPTGPELTALGFLLLGFLTTALSWFGYHAAVTSEPLAYDDLWGMLCFLIDIALIILYGLMLLEFKNGQAVLVILSFIYLLYVAWEAFRIPALHRGPARLLENALFFFLFFLLIFSYQITKYSFLIILAMILSLVYRWAKLRYYPREQGRPMQGTARAV